jgi:hypothetical protein
MSKKIKAVTETPVSLYPPQPKLLIDAMESEFSKFIADPKRKARRLKESLEERP